MRTGKRLRWPLAFVVLVLLVQAVPGQLSEEEEGLVTLYGTVEVASNDDDGDVSTVAIYDNEWGYVLVKNDGVGLELLDLVGTTVEAEGWLTELEEYAEYLYEIAVVSYTVED